VNNKYLTEEGGAGDQGQPDTTLKYMDQTPGQNRSAMFDLIKRIVKERKEKDGTVQTIGQRSPGNPE